MSNEVRFSHINAETGEETNVRTLTRTSILACPFVIMVADHYDANGVCKCSDPAEQKRMRAWGYTKADFKKAGVI